MSLLSKSKLAERLLSSRKVRDAYVYEHVRNGIPFQIRTLRKDRDWSQAELADAADTSRTVITRIEDPNYGRLTLKTLFEIASAFEVALLVKFVPFSRLVGEYEDVSSSALSVPSVSDRRERSALLAWAQAEPVSHVERKPNSRPRFDLLDEARGARQPVVSPPEEFLRRREQLEVSKHLNLESDLAKAAVGSQ